MKLEVVVLPVSDVDRAKRLAVFQALRDLDAQLTRAGSAPVAASVG